LKPRNQTLLQEQYLLLHEPEIISDGFRFRISTLVVLVLSL
jgi:hypothetical protein